MTATDKIASDNANELNLEKVFQNALRDLFEAVDNHVEKKFYNKSYLRKKLYQLKLRAFLCLTIYLIIIPIFLLVFIITLIKTFMQIQGSESPKIFRDHIHPVKTILQFLYSSKIYENIFQEIISDWEEDYYDALRDGRTAKACLEKYRGYFIILSTMIELIITYPIRLVSKLRKLIG